MASEKGSPDVELALAKERAQRLQVVGELINMAKDDLIEATKKWSSIVSSDNDKEEVQVQAETDIQSYVNILGWLENKKSQM